MRYIFTFLLCIIFTTGYSQTLSGLVSGSDKRILEDASIVALRSGTQVRSDKKGAFSLKGLKPGDSVRISYAGYDARTLVYQHDTLNVVLQRATLQLRDVLINAAVSHLNIISNIDLKTDPVNSSQELLRKVPGLFIGQHAGGGKAEQIFLRGFDIDHGTDINITVDGMPVNMVSHAHGQGYADLHFLIPETVDKIDFDKGPYFAHRGNLATAGYVEFKTKERLENSLVTAEGGRFNTYKALGMFNLINTKKEAAYLAAAYQKTDGPFVASQNFNRLNVSGKYTSWLKNDDKLSLGFSHFSSNWDASGQIPERSVLDRSIGWFGAIDSTEGGETQRTNLNLEHTKFLKEGALLKSHMFYSKYRLDLYSNFTFFLNDPRNGDQIRQKDNRDIIGYQSELAKSFRAGNMSFHLQAAVGFRNDNIHDIELSRTANRSLTLENIQLGDINESNVYGYLSSDIRAGKWLINPALRLDYFRFNYANQLTSNTQTAGQTTLSPKLNFLYTPVQNLQLFLKAGKGFHSNDTRVVIAQSSKEILPAAYGADLGFLWKPTPRLILNSALWYLYLQQEFVYVGDEGVMEPSGRTQRRGVDFGMRYQLTNWLFLNSDLTYTHARSLDVPEGENRIPLSVPFTFTGGLSAQHPSGINGSLKARYLASRPANEDNSIIAEGYTVFDLNGSYQFKRFNLGVIVENLFNTKWKETQFATESRLQSEVESVEEIHFTPGTPFNIRAVLTFRF